MLEVFIISWLICASVVFIGYMVRRDLVESDISDTKQGVFITYIFVFLAVFLAWPMLIVYGKNK